MKIAVISDIHSNLQALLAALSDIDGRGIDQIYCLGDIVGYGGFPNECVELIRQRAAVSVLGNHDQAALNPSDVNNFTKPGKIVSEWTNKTLTDENRKFLTALPFTAKAGLCTLVHASPQVPPAWQYVDSMDAARAQFAHFATELCFIGHTHVPALCGEDLKTFRFKKDIRFLINVGSIGQPRDGNPHLSYGILDTEAWSYENIRIPYDIRGAALAITSQGLPAVLAKRLSHGL
jgi:diadenosine tetraphosphatase ApaH/serine/threonine PP2A family protein phosphatase